MPLRIRSAQLRDAKDLQEERDCERVLKIEKLWLAARGAG